MTMRRTLLLIGIVMMAWGTQASAQNAALTRAEASRLLLLNTMDSIPLFPNQGRFSDITQNTVDMRYILAAEHYGILSADNQGHLNPTGPLDRATFLKMLTVSYGLAKGLPSTFSDVSPSDWFEPYVGVAQKYDFFGDKTTLRPRALMNTYEVIYAIALVQSAMIRPNDNEEGAITKEQADDKLNIYIVISTKQLRTVFRDGTETEQSPEDGPEASLQDLRQQVLKLVNIERAKVHSHALVYNRYLTGSAQIYAEDMDKRAFFSHVSPTGETLKDRMQLSGYEEHKYSQSCHCIPGYNLGENLARGQRSPEEAVDGWMHSKPHREALLNPDYKETGIGISGEYWVQHFGAVVFPDVQEN